MPITDLRFLVVEDHEFQRSVLLKILAGLGATDVSEAADGAAALDIVMAPGSAVDIIISDVDMPGMDGMEFMRRLGEAEMPVSIILASALGGLLLGSVETTAKDCGVTILGVIEKPVTPEKLEKLIDLHPPDQQSLDFVPRRPGRGSRDSATPAGFENIAAGLKNKLGRWLRMAQPATPVDRVVMAQISDGDAVASGEILTDFRRVAGEDAAVLMRAVDERDLAQVAAASNRIKGASRTVGAIALATACERLEHFSEAGDWKAIDRNMRVFQRELGRLNAYCEKS